MKLLKRICVLMSMFAILGTTSYAASFKFADKIEYTADSGNNVIVNYYVDEATTLAGMSGIGICYDDSIFEFVPAGEGSQTIDYLGSAVLRNEDREGNVSCVLWAEEDMTDYDNLEKGSTLFTIEFKVKEGQNPVGARFYIEENDNSMTASDYVTNYTDLTGTSITVTPAAPQAVTATDSEGNTRYVAVGTLLNVETTATSVLEATYKNETKEGNLWELLKVEEGATGTIEIKTLTVKMVLPVGSVQPTADDFSFAVEAE